MNPNDLAKLPLFEKLDRHELEALARWTDDVDVPEGKHIVEQGTWAWEFFVILEGEADVLRDGQPVAELVKGDFFGEMAIREHERRNATVVARTPVRLAVMLERDFHAMETEMPGVARVISDAVAERRPD